MEKKCKLLKVKELTSKSGSPYYLGNFCDEDGQTFKVFLSKDIYHSLTFIPAFTDVILKFEFSVFNENISLKLVDVFDSNALE